MFDKKEILKTLNDENYFINRHVLDTFIANWKIDAIYENQDGVEFFDTLSIEKIKKGISLKSQGYDNDAIIYRLNKVKSEAAQEKGGTKLDERFEAPARVESKAVVVENGEVKNLTVDITSQTLQMIAEAVAQKITTDIKAQFESAKFVDELIEAGSFKKDNEILSSQMGQLLDDNKKMAKRIADLESKRPFWEKLFKG